EQNLFEALNIEGFTTLDTDGKAVLAPGTYTYEFNEEYTGSPMTFLSFHQVNGAAGTYYMSTLNGTDNIEWFNVYGGTITVDLADDIYTINATLLNAENEERQFSYTGAIEFTDHTTRVSRTINIDLTEAVAQYAGKYVGTQTDQMYITLTGMTVSATEMAMNQCALLLYTDSDSEIPEGTYTMAGDYEKVPFTAQRGFILGSPSPTYVYVASQVTGEAFYTIDQEGTIKVTKNGNNYTFDIDFVGTSLTTGELVRITSTFNGPISIK
nr:hypothetical protein [Muribaculaceae bacterium]